MAQTSQDNDLAHDIARLAERLETKAGDVNRALDMFSERVSSVRPDDFEAKQQLANPSVLKHNVDAQKDYFSKYKFKYKEQVSKITFLRLVLIDSDNAPRINQETTNEKRHEGRLLKSELKASKAKLSETYEKMEHDIRTSVTKHDELRTQIDEDVRVAQEIQDMRLELSRLRALHPPQQRMTIGQGEAKLEEQLAELVNLGTEEEEATQQLIENQKTLKALEPRVQQLVPERLKMEAAVKKLKQANENGKHEVTEICNWLQSAEALYRKVVGVKSVEAKTENELWVVYDIPVPYILRILFNPATQRFSHANIVDSGQDISDLVDVAMMSNDVPTLIRNVRHRMR